MNERRQYLQDEWQKLEEEEIRLEEKQSKLIELKAIIRASAISNENGKLGVNFEIEKLRLENTNLKLKIQNISSSLKKKSISTKLNLFGIRNDKNYLKEYKDTTDFEDQSEFIKGDKSQNVINKLENIDPHDKIGNIFSESSNESFDELINESKTKLTALTSKKNLNKEQRYYETKYKYDSTAESNDSNTEDSEKDTSDVPNFIEKNINAITTKLNEEKNNVQKAYLLLEKYKNAIINRELKLKSDQLKFSPSENNSENENQKDLNDITAQYQKLVSEKETIVLENLNLFLTKLNYLNNQKSHQLRLLEIQLSVDHYRKFNSNEKINIAKEIEDSNQHFFNQKSNIEHSNPKNNNLILNNIRKINKRFNALLRNFVSLGSFINEIKLQYIDDVENQNVLNRKLEGYVNNHERIDIKIEKYFMDQNIWEKSPTYQRLAIESGSRILDQKWDYYFGSKIIGLKKNYGINSITISNSKKLRNDLTSYLRKSLENLNGGFDLQFRSPASKKLPESTQFRINTHKKWLKNFKDELNSNLKLQ